MSTRNPVLGYLKLNRLFAGRPRRACEMLSKGFSADALCERIARENLWGMRDDYLTAERTFNASDELEQCVKQGISIITIADEEYPALLREIVDPPLVLYVRGKLQALDAAAVAIIGSRKPTPYGLLHSREFSIGLAQAGITVVSGLARGIDQSAHQGCLQAPAGRTIAVLGCGMDVLYPRGSEALKKQIAERGAVITEYPLGTEPRPYNFPARNRIISGLSLGVFVVEAHKQSGSLITAREALDQGREVFALPGRVDHLTSQGTHLLIREGATLVESYSDIVEVVVPMMKGFSFAVSAGMAEESFDDRKEHGEAVPNLSSSERADEKDQIEAVLRRGPLRADELFAFVPVPVDEFYARLMELELAGSVKKTPDSRYEWCS